MRAALCGIIYGGILLLLFSHWHGERLCRIAWLEERAWMETALDQAVDAGAVALIAGYGENGEIIFDPEQAFEQMETALVSGVCLKDTAASPENLMNRVVAMGYVYCEEMVVHSGWGTQEEKYVIPWGEDGKSLQMRGEAFRENLLAFCEKQTITGEIDFTEKELTYFPAKSELLIGNALEKVTFFALILATSDGPVGRGEMLEGGEKMIFSATALREWDGYFLEIGTDEPRYHRPDCTAIFGEGAYYEDKKSCAEKGGWPCQICQP